jgi:hypothetical protein
MKYFHHSAISASLFHSVFRFDRHFDPPFLSGFVPFKNGRRFQLDSPGIRTRHFQIGVERSSAFSSNYRRKWQNIGITFFFHTRDSKQQMETASV